MSNDAVSISLFAHRLSALCEEMGAVLKRSAISPNIRDREDFSCALFDRSGQLIAQAAHIPVHLGSMAFAMADVVGAFDWQPGDVVVFNDPALGGTHLPDITVVSPVFLDTVVGTELFAFSATRAHHADIGGKSPGSMGVETSLEDEGLIISPCYWFEAGHEQAALAVRFRERVRAPEERLGDLSAQKAACMVGARRLAELPVAGLDEKITALMAVSEAYGRNAIDAIPDGRFTFEDALEDDGCGSGPLPIRVEITIAGDTATVDFSGSAAVTPGPVNCPMAVTAASVLYVFRCLMPAHTPQTSAVFHPINIVVPEGCLLHATDGAAVAAGNVETSQRIVDVVLGALAQAIPERIPAAAQGTMNNVIFGGDRSGSDQSGDDQHDGEPWLYYETLAGGMGAHAGGNGLSAVQCHMTNTKNSSIEVLEMHYPLQIREYAVRSGSGGDGLFVGGDGMVREWVVSADCSVSLLTERRTSMPYGLQGGDAGASGRNCLCREGVWQELAAKGSWQLQAGDVIRIETPGGGGFGIAEEK
ncbi:hydantoinase B/oxoprolinase family protein [Mariprofundus sp. EBB-1]|uniref:hydantoinase B/oxoprolinase family protein n=1 Tax=Mariprofundus sp. EBB-1 TaxID=2650971 RepID=UPI000EF19BB9|nr:hydantoinase B/oxoprolinase family protein [Mariprofundus sp. EBB-1]RLL55560.1 hydantoinase B/oxoprolinase family protein [Mariprofundus sp. EBB-1]